MRQLVREHRRDADRDGRRHPVALQLPQLLQEWQVGLDRGFGEPVAAVGPAPVVEHPRQVAVQGEHEVDGHQAAVRPATALW
jgi:hypothetical protein